MRAVSALCIDLIRSFAPGTRLSLLRASHPFAHSRGARGNVFALLFGAVALTGVLAAVGMQTLTGPVTTITRVTQKNIAETNLLMNAKIIANAVPLGANLGDIDSDTTKEAAAFVPATGGETAPTNGGFLPTTLGLTLTDPWGSKYGYCVWDHGTTHNSTNYIPGDPGTVANQIGVQPLIAIISSGPDKVFQTACPAFVSGIMNVAKAGGSDDLVQEFTYEGASAAANGLWTLNAPGGDTAQLRDSANSTVKVSVNRDTGIGDFVGVTTATLAAKTDNVAIDGGLKLDVLNETTPEVCDAANAGVIRFKLSEKALVMCDGVSAWVPAGSDVWKRDANGVYLKTLSDKVGIGTATPSVALDVVGSTKISQDLGVTGKGTVTGDFLVGTQALSVLAGSNFVGIGKAVPTTALDVIGDTMLTGGAAITENLAVDTDTLFVDSATHTVGIGTATPVFDLDIIATKTIGTVGSLNKDNAVVRIQEAASGPNMYMDGNTILSDAGMIFGTIGNAGIQFLTNNNVAFGMDAGGNSNAYGSLGVNGTLTVGGSTSLGDTLTVVGSTSIDTNTLFVDATANNVGIGTASPQAKLDVDGGIKLGLHQAGTACSPDGVIQWNGSRMEICSGGTWRGVASIEKLDDIGDVDVPMPDDGQVLSWDDSSGKWVAKNIIDLGPAAVNPAGDNGSVQFKTGSDLDADKDYFHWDKTTHSLGVGNAAPAYTLDVTGIANVSTDVQVGRDLLVTRNGSITGNLTVDSTTFFVSATNNNVGIGTNNPHSSALLDLTSTTGGLLPPRMNVTQRNTISTPATGLMLFNTTNNKLQVWDGMNWLNVGAASGLGSTMIDGWPDAINCGEVGYPSLYYLTYAPLQSDGRYYYRNILDSANYSVIFNPDKTYYNKTGTSETGCVGKSINTLYAQTRAFNFVGGSQAGEGGSMVTDVPDALDCGSSGTQRFFFLQTATVAGYTYVFNGGGNGIGMQMSFGPLPAGTGTLVNTAKWPFSTGCEAKTLTQLAGEDRAFYMVGGSTPSGAGSPPAGGGGYIQFNTAGALDADSALTFNATLDRLVLGGGAQFGPDATCSGGGGDNGTMRFQTNKFEFCVNGAWFDMAKSGVANETDPQVGSLTNSKWCTSDGTTVNCTSNEPIVVESDPKIGTLTSGKWCSTNGSTVSCTNDAPGISDGNKGDITVSGSGSSWAINSASVSYAKIQNVATQKLLGRYAAGSGSVQEITIGTGLTLDSSGNLTAAGGSGATSNVGYLQIAGASNAMTDSGITAGQQLFWDNSAKALGIGNAAPAASSILDLTSTNKGFLPPRMTTLQRNAIATPATGLTVYNTTTNALETYNGSAWLSGVASTIPSFFVHRNSVNQTATPNGTTPLDWTTKSFDTNTNFDLTTDRFTPTVAGKYLISTAVWCYPSSNRCDVYVLKNGSNFAQSVGGTGTFYQGAVTTILDMNGTTDYVSVSAYNGAGAEFNGAGNATYFTGTLIGGGGGGGSSQWANVTGGLSFAAGGAAVGTATLNTSAILQADSTTKGFLPPRMTTAQRAAIATPATGLVVYDTTANNLYIYNGTAWSALSSGTGLTGVYYSAAAVSNAQVQFTGAANSAPSYSGGVLTLASNTSYAVVELWGGGGAGGTSATCGTNIGAGGGGGAGGYATKFIANPTGNYYYTVGTAAAASCFGTNATACTSALVTANGGSAGVAGAAGIAGAGGAGGSATGGDVNLNGGDGGGGTIAICGQTQSNGGAGGASPYGGGASNTTVNGTGSSGRAPGGGAQGAGGSANSGGTGAVGGIKISAYTGISGGGGGGGGGSSQWTDVTGGINYSGGVAAVGTANTTISNASTIAPKMVVNGAGAASGLQIVRNTTVGAGGAHLVLSSNRGADANTYTALQSADGIGTVGFYGADGTRNITAASITALVDGTVATDVMPTRLIFNTSSSTSGANAPVERMRIDANGGVSIGSAAGAAASSLLDLTSTTKGFLPPRMTTVQRTAIATPAAGLTVYDTDLKGLYIYNGTTWTAVGSASSPYGFFGYTASGLSYSAGSTLTSAYTETFDTGSNFNAATGVFTAPVAGTYIFTGLVHVNTATGSDVYSYLNKNGSVYTYGARNPTNVATNTMSPVVAIMSLAIGDTVQLGVGTNTAATNGFAHFAGSILGGGSSGGGGSSQWTDISGGINYSAGNVGIGTATPNPTAQPVSLYGKVATIASQDASGGRALLELWQNTDTVAAGGPIGQVSFLAGATTANLNAAIVGTSEGTDEQGANLRFYTKPIGGGTGITGTVERMRIGADGGVSIGSAANPATSSILDLTSTTKGFLPPRMTTAQRIAITTPTTGLIVYDTDLNSLYIKTASSWTAVGSSGTQYGVWATAAGSYAVGYNDFASMTKTNDLGSNFNAATGVFTAPVAGYYAVAGNAFVTGTPGNMISYIKKNGTVYQYGARFGNGGTGAGGQPFSPFSGIIYLAVGETTQGGVYTDTASATSGGTIGIAYIGGGSGGGGGSSQWTDVSGGVNYSAGNVGIGTATPASVSNNAAWSRYATVESGTTTGSLMSVGATAGAGTGTYVGSYSFHNASISGTEKRIGGIAGRLDGAVDSGSMEFFLFEAGVGRTPMVMKADGRIGIGANPSANGAQLEIASTTRGFLPPRMTTTQRDAIVTPAAGLVVYNSTTNSLNLWNGSSWLTFGSSIAGGTTIAANVPDVLRCARTDAGDNLFYIINNGSGAATQYVYGIPGTDVYMTFTKSTGAYAAIYGASTSLISAAAGGCANASTTLASLYAAGRGFNLVGGGGGNGTEFEVAFYANGSTTSLASGAWNDVVNPTQVRDVGGDNYNPTTGKFTAPSDGTYFFSASNYSGSTTSGRIGVAVQINTASGLNATSTVCMALASNAGSVPGAASCSGSVYLTAGQIVEVDGYQEMGSATALSGSYNTFSGFKLGGGGGSSGGGGATPAGSNTYVQFNDGGSALGASANFAYDKTANAAEGKLTVGSTTANTAGATVLEATGKASANAFIAKGVSGLSAPLGGTTSWSTNGTDVWRLTGKVGVGTSTPAAPFEVSDPGTNLGIRITSGAGSAALNLYTTEVQSGLNRNWAIRNRYTNNGTLEFSRGATEGAAPTVVAMAIDRTSQVGIGTNAPTKNLHVYQSSGFTRLGIDTGGSGGSTLNLMTAGAIKWEMYNDSASSRFFLLDGDDSHGVYMDQNTSGFTGYSDVRLKNNIKPYSVLDRLDDYRAVTFDWKSTGNADIGVIAQELYKSFPEVVDKGSDGGEIKSLKDKGVWGVHYDKLGALALEGLKELKAMFVEFKTKVMDLLDRHEKEIQELKAENAALKARLDALEAKIEGRKE